MDIRKHLLEISVFISGAVVMVFELASARSLAPQVGTSILIWSIIISIFLGALSYGYYLGGRLADRHSDIKGLAAILLIASAALFYCLALMPISALVMRSLEISVIAKAFLSASLLFAPATIALGTVSPYAAKLKIHSLSASGSAVGTLSAWSTLGSIFGTLSAGFILLPTLGVFKLVLLLALICLALSIWIDPKLSALRRLVMRRPRRFLVLLSALALVSVISFFLPGTPGVLAEVETSYQNIRIVEGLISHRPVRLLMTDQGGSQSGFYLDTNENASRYLNFFRLYKQWVVSPSRALALGGAAYIYPRDFLREEPQAEIDVVEIDPGMTEVAKKYFNLENERRLHIFHQDGRVFLNQATSTYDLIFGDAFSAAHSLPFQLTTKEAIERQYQLLSHRGLAITNVISSFEGRGSDFLRAEYATFKSVFSQVEIFQVRPELSLDKVQNFIIVASKSTQPLDFESDDPKLQALLQKRLVKSLSPLPVLTDDRAPVEYYASKIN